jgi:hypothetical protein
MTTIKRRVLEIALGLSLAVGTGGCSRTEDGSVVIPRHLDMRRIWQNDEPQPPNLLSEDPTFPVAPVGQRASGQRDSGQKRDRRHRRVDAAPAGASPAPGLACHEPSGSDGRVQMLCD